MEALSVMLQPHKDLVANLASWASIAQFCTGVLICKDIYKQGSTKGFNVGPFVGGIVIGILFLKYGFLLSDPASITVNVVCIGLNLLFTIFYYTYAVDKNAEVFKPLAYGTVLAGVILGYAEVESPDVIVDRFGLIVTVLLLGLIGMPLLDVRQIVSEKDASSIPFALTVMATIVSFLWLLYGVILLNYFIIAQNVVAIALCVFQLILIFVYPGKGKSHHSQNKNRKKSTKKD